MWFIRIAELSQALVGHIRGRLAQVTTVFSMFFSGMSGSSSADVAVLSRTMAAPMSREGYEPGFVAAGGNVPSGKGADCLRLRRFDSYFPHHPLSQNRLFAG